VAAGDDDVSETPAPKPIDPSDAYVQALAYIDLARQRGTSWDTLAARLSLPGKREVKRMREEFARQVRLLQAGLRQPQHAGANTPEWFDPEAASRAADPHRGDRVMLPG
jgi:hypothetical protein